MMFKIISLRYKFSKKSDETGHSLFGFFYYKFLIYKIKKIMAYLPQSFHYTVNEMGIRVYDDKHVQVTYINLRTLSQLIYSLRTQAQIDLQDAINNVGVHAVKDQTFQILGMFASKILEGISAFWPAGTPAAYISMIIGKIASGVITKLIE